MGVIIGTTKRNKDVVYAFGVDFNRKEWALIVSSDEGEELNSSEYIEALMFWIDHFRSKSDEIMSEFTVHQADIENVRGGGKVH